MYRKVVSNVIGLFCFSAICFALENPNVGSSFNVRNAPSSSGQRQRYITRGNPYGKSANDIVTGNVGGGKHFRGVVPYGSSYYSSAYTNSAGTGSVNDFIRRSQNPIANDRNPGQVRTFVDPRRSVSSISRPDGTSGLLNPQLRAQGHKTNPYMVPHTEQVPAVKYERPFSDNNMTLDQILARREQLREEAAKRQKAAKQDQESDEESTEKKGFFDEVLSPEQIKERQQDKLQELSPEQIKQKQQNKLQDKQKQEPDTTLEPKEDYMLTKPLTEDQNGEDEQQMETENKETPGSEKADDTRLEDLTNPKSDFIPEVDLQNLSAEGRRILGEHKKFASLADEKFTGFMNTAESFIKEGKYYKAADAYALATIWKPKDARAYLGQSFSLFAAGEYMSSAYYLSRGFELNSKAATKKYNLAEFVGNRDVFEDRVVEITQWQEQSGAGELAFLLAYISYQDGKAVRAVDEIRKAKEAMPNEQAVAILKNIIDPEEVQK